MVRGTSVSESFAMDTRDPTGDSKRPSSTHTLLTRPPRACQDKLFTRVRYVEVFRDARTPLADFFSLQHFS